MRLISTLISFTLLLSLTSCFRPCHDYDVVGACEFVLDSYKIRHGKFAILEMEGIEFPEMPYDAMQEYRDTIAEDDILNIVLYHPTRGDLMKNFEMINSKMGGFRVYDGEVNLPDITPVYVQGMSLMQAQNEIQRKFREQIQDVEVFVSYKQRLSRKVDLTGMVKTPSVPVDGKIRLYEVIAQAKLPPDANLFKSYILRDGLPMPVDFYKLINEGDMSQNIVMRGGDKIFIAPPSESVVMMMGELNCPTAVNVPYGFITLPEAIVKARGIPYTGDRCRIQVIRGGMECPKIYVLSWEQIVNLPNDSMLLIPGDTVYVTAKPITEWNRFIDQVLPSGNAFMTGFGIYKIFVD